MSLCTTNIIADLGDQNSIVRCGENNLNKLYYIQYCMT